MQASTRRERVTERRGWGDGKGVGNIEKTSRISNGFRLGEKAPCSPPPSTKTSTGAGIVIS
jgi:hypothetical protein